MNWPVYLLLTAGLIFWMTAFLEGLKRPKRLLLLCVGFVSAINFSFFPGEVMSRVALPDILFLTLFIVGVIRQSLLHRDTLGMPKGPSLFFGLFIFSLLCSYFAPPFNRAMMFGEGNPLSVLFGMMMFVLVTEFIRTEKDYDHYLWAWTAACGLTLVISFIDMGDLFAEFHGVKYDDYGYFGLWDLFLQSDFPHPILSPYSFRIIGSFRNTGQLAAFALTSLFVVLAFSFRPGHRKSVKVLLWAMCCGLLVCMILTGRGSVIPSAAAGFGMLLIYFSRRSKRLILGWLFVGAITTTVFVVAISNNPDILRTALFRNLNELLNVVSGKGYFSHQIQLAFQAFRQYPLFGIGFGRFIESEYHEFIRGHGIHSSYVQILAETGIFGMVSYLLMMGYFLFLAFRNVRQSWKTPWQDFYMILFLACLSLPLSYWYNRHLKERTFWLLIAAIYIGSRLLLARKVPEKITGDTVRDQTITSRRRMEVVGKE